MKKLFWILLIFPLFANASYQRNSAQQVNKVVFGEVDSVRYITEQEVVQSQGNGWETLLGATIGGLIGNQFGDGRGRELATVAGVIVGASTARNRQSYNEVVQYNLVELLVKTESGQLINVIQDVDSSMVFNRNDKVRILYFDSGVRVDKTY